MPLDTTDFDTKISGLQTQLDTLQGDLNNDPFNIQLTALKNKENDISVIANQVELLKINKNKAIAAQDIIDSKNLEIISLKEYSK